MNGNNQKALRLSLCFQFPASKQALMADHSSQSTQKNFTTTQTPSFLCSTRFKALKSPTSAASQNPQKFSHKTNTTHPKTEPKGIALAIVDSRYTQG
ncbi:hypothetical protein GQ457_02G003290 [Hibiscus cannabinus]